MSKGIGGWQSGINLSRSLRTSFLKLADAKRYQGSTIDEAFISSLTLTLLAFYRCRRDQSSTISLCDAYRERKLPSTNANEDRRSVTSVLSSDSLSSLILPDAEFLSASGKCFGCRFFN
jgi:hypothetical protein